MRSAIVVVVLAGTAHAQPAPAIDVMADRWAVDASLWGGSMTPRVEGASGASIGGLELAGRWRIREPIELALALQLGGGENGTVTMGGLWIDARWRFMTDQAWNVIALAGLGVVTITAKDNATDTEKQGRGALRVGGGVERRFGSWAIEADLRITAVTKNDGVTTIDQPTPQTYQLSRYGSTGASLSIGANYYF